MKAWMFEAMKKLSHGEKVAGPVLLGLRELGYIILDQSCEEWIPTPEAHAEFMQMNRELDKGSVIHPAG